MKRKILCVSLLLSCLLTACSPTADNPSIPQQFETTARIQYKEIAATAEIRKDEGSCDVRFTSPEALTDMSFLVTQQDVTIDYRGIQLTVDPATFPGNAAVALIVKAINRATEQEGVSVRLEDGAFVVTGDSTDGAFELRLDAKNGNMLTLSMQDLFVEFLNFDLLK